ncbi:MAG TPA: tRNA (adenosine(37)-N6)-dimethylallyltransferase MiaA [Baekduia sp.]|nr:tRNA (adenosine(37)-N6)-dimethylallyltransferase MiaA [Baekduia sp.]
MPQILAIFGPTAIGKTALAIALAERLRAAGEDPVAVSADALQVYRGLEILTGAATIAEQAQLEHRLVSFVPITQTFSVGEYAPRAHAEIDALLEAGRTPIVVGGTGLYLRAALAELDLDPPPPPQLRADLNARAAQEGSLVLHTELGAVAPWAAARIEPGDRTRVVRALELHAMGALHERSGPNRLWTATMRHPTRLIGLTLGREALRARVDDRVAAIVAAGAAEEVRAAAAAGASETARKALGFQELLTGDVDALRTRTRQYARRQLTWMRKLGHAELFDADAPSAAQLAARIDSPR